MKTILTSIGLAVALAGPAAATTQFDLICKPDRSKGYKSDGDVRHYRLDLTAKRWCWLDCTVAKPIVDVTADMIILAKPELTDGLRNDHSINRSTGTFTQSLGGYSPSTTTGTCTPAPFSGLPEPGF